MVGTAVACGPTPPGEGQDGTGSASTVGIESSGGGEATGSQTGEVPTTTAGPGDAGESDGSGEPGDTEGPLPQDFPCEGARFVTIHAPGEFFKVLVDSRGHIYACGTAANEWGPGGLVAEFDPSGAHVRDTAVAVTDKLGAGVVGCDAVDAGDRLPVLVSKATDPSAYHFELQTYAPDGALAAEFAFDDEPYPFMPWTLSVGLDGTSIFTGEDAANTFIVQKRDSTGGLLWDQFGTDLGFQPHSLSAAGHLVATRSPDRLLVVSGDDGTIVWERTWPLSGPGIADINDAGEVALAVNTDGLELAVARFDAAGTPVGETRFTIHDQLDHITDIAINNAGAVAAVGYLQGPAQRTFVARLDAAGDLVATHVCDATLVNGGYAVAIDDAGSVVIAGTMFLDRGPAQNFVAAFDGPRPAGCGETTVTIATRPRWRRRRR